MKISVRDDDLCYYSSFPIFKKIYDELGIPVSISLIPKAVANHGNLMPYGSDKPVDMPIFFTENVDLVSGIKDGIKNNKYEILLHGYSHEYKIGKKGNLVGEMIWKDKHRLINEIREGKELIEKTFDIKLNTFVAPSQEIDQKGIDVISSLGMNYCGIANRLKDRKISVSFVLNILKRHLSRLLFGKVLIGTVKYKDHKEHGIIGLCDYEELIRCFNICLKHNIDFIIVTHYWELDEKKEKYESLKRFIEYIKKNNMCFSFVGENFK